MENNRAVEFDSAVAVQLAQKTITAGNERAAAVGGLEPQITQPAEMNRPAIYERVGNRAGAEPYNAPGVPVSADTDLVEATANGAGRKKIGFALEGNFDRAVHGIIAEQSAEFSVGGALRQGNSETSAPGSDDRCGGAHASTSGAARCSVQSPRKISSQPVRRCNATAFTAPARWPMATQRRR